MSDPKNQGDVSTEPLEEGAIEAENIDSRNENENEPWEIQEQVKDIEQKEIVINEPSEKVKLEEGNLEEVNKQDEAPEEKIVTAGVKRTHEEVEDNEVFLPNISISDPDRETSKNKHKDNKSDFKLINGCCK